MPGRRVMKGPNPPSTYELYFYGIGGQELETKSCHDTNLGVACDTAVFDT